MISRFIDRLNNADADLREVIIGSAVAFSIKVIAAGSVFAMTVIISRTLGASEAGIFFLALTLVTIIASISRIGLDQTFVRFISSHREENDWRFINGLFHIGMKWSLLASLIASFLLWKYAEPIAECIFNKHELTSTLSTIAMGIPLVALFTLQARALQGLKHIAKAMIVLGVISPLLIAFLVLSTAPGTAHQTSWLFLVSVFISLLIGFYWWWQIPETKINQKPIESGLILSSCLPLLLVDILNHTVSWSSQLFLGAWSSSADIAVFNAAQRTAMLTSFILIAVNSISAPKFSTMYHLGQLDALDRMVRNSTRIMIFLSLPPLLILLLFPDRILELFGSGFSQGYISLMILGIAQFINVSTGSVGFLLAMTGHEKTLRNNTFIAAVIAIALGIVLIPTYGIIGASISTGSAIVCSNLLSVWQARKILEINTMAIWR